MTSSNEQVSHPPMKTRLSPLDFRNNELVSRLLAATPPYLYNMSLLPNTFFFSEMLRSLVQARAENATRNNLMTNHARRSRKRSWTARNESYVPRPPKSDKGDDWEKLIAQRERSVPVELTTKPPEQKQEFKANKPETNFPQQPEPSNSNMMLPPAPPVWFPPIYPSPYVDPLHFFIDLRVSGHIYDKNQKTERQNKEELPATVTSCTSQESTPSIFGLSKDYRHKSAFSVPIHKRSSQQKCKFDVKSMGFEKSTNKLNAPYIMANIKSIYNRVTEGKDILEEIEPDKSEDSKSTPPFESISEYTSRSSRSRSSNSSSDSSSVDVVDLQEEQDIKLDM